MNKADSGSDKSNKIQLIIEVAQKRFGTYGIEKTSDLPGSKIKETGKG